MTPHEFDQWRNDYKRRFPSINDWFAKKDEDLQRGIMQTWQECLEKVELRDALAVNKAMSTGQVQPVQPFREDHTALEVRAYASRIAGERTKRVRQDTARVSYDRDRMPQKCAPLAILYKISGAARREFARKYDDWQTNEYRKASLDRDVAEYMRGYWDLEAEHDSNEAIRAAVLAKAEEDEIAWQHVTMTQAIPEDEATNEQLLHVINTMEGK